GPGEHLIRRQRPRFPVEEGLLPCGEQALCRAAAPPGRQDGAVIHGDVDVRPLPGVPPGGPGRGSGLGLLFLLVLVLHPGPVRISSTISTSEMWKAPRNRPACTR